jgi:bidirectional [NiFe] hydrogenase diaphorase subunit
MASERQAPSGAAPRDNRWKLVEATMRRHGHRAHSLIETLHSAQEAYGYIEPEVLKDVALQLRVPLSKAFGVATFYSFFTLKPQGRHTCVICTGTACYIKGAGALVDVVEQEAGVRAGGTSADGGVSLLTARCFGSCGLAPAAVVDGEVLGKLAPEALGARVRKWVRHDA